MLLSIAIIGFNAYAQEFNFNVTLNSEKATTTDKKVFESLELTLKDFLNSQKWTEDEFEPEERIDCNVQLTIIEELSANSFKADFIIRATRPVFNSDYQTTLLSYADKGITFEYEPYQPIEYSDNVFTTNLASILAFYSYTILGLDYDSFSPYGGEKYFQKAQDILNAVPPNLTGTYKGWRALDGNRNRYWLIESILSPRTRKLRQAMYDYHRQGLDVMAENVDLGRAKLSKVLDVVEEVNKNYPNAMIIQMFTLAKGDEIVEIFKGGNKNQQDKAIRILTRLDASSANKYRKIRG